MPAETFSALLKRKPSLKVAGMLAVAVPMVVIMGSGALAKAPVLTTSLTLASFAAVAGGYFSCHRSLRRVVPLMVAFAIAGASAGAGVGLAVEKKKAQRAGTAQPIVQVKKL